MSIYQYFQSHPELTPQLEAARESFSKQTENLSFTAFVLNQKIVQSEDYLAWAQVHFELVILKNDYFQMNSPDMTLWSRWQETYPWSNECLPVGEWDGVLFVGCIEKPMDFNPTVPVCFALCSPNHLKTWSQTYFSKADQARPAFHLELKDDADPSDIENKSAEFSGAEEENSLLNLQDPASVTMGSILIKLAPPEPLAVPETRAITPAPQSISVKEVVPEMNEVAPSAVTLIKAQPKVSALLQNEKVGLFLLSKLNSYNKDLSAELKALCEPLVTNFDKYLILSVDTNETEARPLIWSKGFNPGVANYSISLKVPSMFYIVAATYKPFHGPVSANDVNEKFFDDWNMSQTPGHATLVPLLQKDRLIGILLALGESNAYNNHILRLVVKSAAEISQKVADQQQKAAA